MACELQESCSKRATFIDNFIERQVKILTDPVFGNIQDAPSVTTKGVTCKHSLQSHPGIKGTSFATTVAPAVEEDTHWIRVSSWEKDLTKRR